MKAVKSVLSLALAIILMCSIGVVAFADAPSAPEPSMSQAQSLEDAAAGEWAEEELPAVSDITPADERAATDAPDEQQAESPQEQPAPEKSSNTPYLVGAVLAVAMFIGVAVFCKFKGNR